MKKKILVPTDFSKNAWTALVYACDLFKERECEFYIVNVYHARGYAIEHMTIPEVGVNSYDRAKKKSQEGFDKLRDMLRFREGNERHDFFMISQYNGLLEAMKDIIEKKDIDLVVMGTKGATNAENRAFGSNAVDAMEKIRNCPVLTIPLEARYGRINEIVFPTNYKTPFKHRELVHMIEIAQISGAAIRVLYVAKNETLSQEQENYKSLLEEYSKEVEYSFHILHTENVHNAVQDFVESRQSECIAFVNRKHFFFKSIFSNPLAKRLGMHSKVPVLAMHTINNK